MVRDGARLHILACVALVACMACVACVACLSRLESYSQPCLDVLIRHVCRKSGKRRTEDGRRRQEEEKGREARRGKNDEDRR